jgi:hypothetical protein
VIALLLSAFFALGSELDEENRRPNQERVRIWSLKRKIWYHWIVYRWTDNSQSVRQTPD